MNPALIDVHSRLYTHYDEPLDDTNLSEDLDLITQYHATVSEAPDVLFENIPSTLHSGSVGGFLYGCLQTSDYSVCTPDCTRGLHWGTSCGVPSYVKDAGGFSKLNMVEGTEATIFVQSGHQLTISDKVKLLSEGIQTVKMYHQTDDTTSYTLVTHLPVSQTSFSDGLNPNLNTGKTGYAWVWMLLIIIVLVAITVWLVRP